MPVKLRGDKWQYDFTHKGNRYRIGGFDTKAEAEQAEAACKASVLLGRTPHPIDAQPADHSRMQTLEGLYEHVMVRYWEGTKSVETHRINATECIQILGLNTHPADVDENALDRLIHKLKTRPSGRPLTNGTINRKLASIRFMLRKAFDRRVIARMPKVELLEEAEHRIRFWSAEEEAEVLKYFEFIGDNDMADLFILLCDSGVRLGTALKLRWQDNFNTGTWDELIVHGDQDKTKHARAIPLTNRLKNVLTLRFSKAASAGDRVFILSKDQCEHRWTRCKKSLGQKQAFAYFGRDSQAVLHTCRHTFASRLVQRGVSLPVVKELMGHRNISTTMRYAHLRAADSVDAIKKLEGVA